MRCFNPSYVPWKSIQGEIQHSQQIDKSTRRKDRVLIDVLMQPQQKISSDHHTAYTHASKLPKSHTPTVKHFDFPEPTQKLIFNFE